MLRRFAPQLAAALCTLALWAVAAPLARGQGAPRLTGLPTQQALQRWDKRTGLHQNTVSALARTPDGYVWIGVGEGLHRFDGRTFTYYNGSTTPAFNRNSINVLYTGRDGRLWVGTAQGVGTFADGHYTPATLPVLERPDVYDVVEAPNGHLWVATLSGVLRLEGGAVRLFNAAHGLADTRALALALGPRGRLYVGTPSGLFRTTEDGRFEPVGTPGQTGLVRALFAAPDGIVYVGGETGLFQVRPGGTLEPAPFPGHQACAPVRAIGTDAQGVLWLGTRGQGACTLLDGAFVPVTTAQGAPAGDLRAFLTDPEGGLWMGADGGLVRMRRSRLSTFSGPEGLPGHATTVVHQDRSETVWIGTDDGGLVRLSASGARTFGVAEGLRSMTVMAVAEHDGALWVASGDGQARSGLCRLNASQTRFQCLQHPEAPDLDVAFALLSANETLWVGTRQGVALLQGGRLAPLPDSLNPLLGMVNALVRDRGGDVWAGSLEAGLVRYRQGDPAQPVPYGASDGLPSHETIALHQDERGTVWAGLKSGDLCRYVPAHDRFRCYNSDHGLVSSQIMQVVSDERGYLWVGTNSGYERIRLDDFDRLDAEAIGRLGVDRVGLNEASGLRDPEAMGAVQPSALRLADGRLAFGTVGGLGLYDPEEALRYVNRVPPPVHVDRVRTHRSDLALSDALVDLPVGERDLHVTLSVVAFTDPDAVVVRYRLEGYDDQWQTLDPGVRSIAFTSLPPGAYRLRVQAANAEGVWNSDGATLAFRVPPRLYETGGFRALLVLMGLALVGCGVRWRMRALVARQEVLERTVSERTAELQASQTELLARERDLERVNEGLEAEVRRQVESRMDERRHYEQELIGARDKAEASARLKETILNNMSHEIRTPITAILGFSEVLAHEVPEQAREFVHYIDENGKRLLTTLNTVLDFSHLEGAGVHLQPTTFDAVPIVQRVGRLFEPIVERSGSALTFDLPERLLVTTDHFGFERILTHLLSNAVKFTDAGEIRCALSATDEAVTLVVADTGCGIAEDFLPDLYEPFKQESFGLARQHEGTGLGLSIVKRFVEAMQGRVQVETAKDTGTTFTVTLPRHLDLAAPTTAAAPARSVAPEAC